jgi:hypothetical protein
MRPRVRHQATCRRFVEKHKLLQIFTSCVGAFTPPRHDHLPPHTTLTAPTAAKLA